MPEASLCNGSNTQFSGASSFLPGENVTITCSVPDVWLAWYTPRFTKFGAVLLSLGLGISYGSRFDGAIIFQVIDFITSPNSSCMTTTATIANIQESFQGLDLGCYYDGIIWTTVVIDVVGKLYIV